MGRGRAKAKQAKVARQLKYQTSDTSIEDLREELGAAPTPTVPAHDAEDLYGDPYDGDEPDDEPYDADAEPDDGWTDGYARVVDGGEAGQSSQRG